MHYPLAAFHLHQAAEQLYTGIIYSITGLRVQTHNLDKLYRYSRYLVQGLAAIFPRDTVREKSLFKLLQSSYIQSRYSINYRITPIECTILNNRIVKLLQLCQAIKNAMPFYI
jgi:HEPN domain-containing protein